MKYFCHGGILEILGGICVKSIRVHNLRSLVNVEKIELAPITVFLGKNSAGKSTMLRTFPLLKQSMETRISEPLLWYGDYVDFGSFDESLNAKNRIQYPDQEKTIDFEYEFELMGRDFKTFMFPTPRNKFGEWKNVVKDQKDILFVKVKNGKGKMNYCSMTFFQRKIEMFFDKSADKVKILFNGRENVVVEAETAFITNGFLPHLILKNKKDEHILLGTSNFHHNFFYQELLELFQNFSLEDDSDFDHLFSNFPQLDSEEDMFLRLQEILRDNQYLSHKMDEITLDSELFHKIFDLITAFFLADVIATVNAHFVDFAEGLVYSKPLRADVQRYYRRQGLYVGSIEPSGSNIPMFLNNLNPNEIKEFAEFSEKYFGFSFGISGDTGHVSLTVKKGDQEACNLADEGVGYSQILPLIANLWHIQRRHHHFRQNSSKNLFAIEQPELHLHPALQGKLVAAFASENFIKNNKVVMETHSETIVSRLGYLIAKGALSHENVRIYLFEKNKNGDTEVRESTFNEKGKLKDWPIGFFSPEV